MDIFFAASKMGWVVLTPSNLLLLLILISIVLARYERTSRLGRRIGMASVLALLIVSLFPAGDLLLTPLERRFPPFQNCPAQDAASISGIILLGGSLNAMTTDGRIEEVLSGSADRIRLAAALSRTYPAVPVVISGGRAFPRVGGRSEAAATSDFLRELSVSPDRIVLETDSRTTAENAAFVARRAGPHHGRWLLVTSAFHMPRAIGTFRAAGVDVIAAPTDWQVDEDSPLLAFNVADRLRTLDLAAKEYLGLFTYWATGRSNDLFPGPGGANGCERLARHGEPPTGP